MRIWIMGLVMTAIGCTLVFWTGRRAFYRRNAAGVEEFRSYAGALTTRAFEAVAR